MGIFVTNGSHLSVKWTSWCIKLLSLLGIFTFFFFSQQFEKSNLVWTTVMASVNCRVLLSLESVATDTTTSHDHITITLNLDTALEVEPRSFLWKLISGAQHQNYLNRSTKPRREQHKQHTEVTPHLPSCYLPNTTAHPDVWHLSWTHLPRRQTALFN